MNCYAYKLCILTSFTFELIASSQLKVHTKHCHFGHCQTLVRRYQAEQQLIVSLCLIFCALHLQFMKRTFMQIMYRCA